MKSIHTSIIVLSLPIAGALIGCTASQDEETSQGELAIEAAESCLIGSELFGTGGKIKVTADPTDTGYRVTRIEYTIKSAGVLPAHNNFYVTGVIKERAPSGWQFKTRTIDFGQPKVTIKSGWFDSGEEARVIELETQPVDVAFGEQMGLRFSQHSVDNPKTCDATIYAFTDSFAPLTRPRIPEAGETCAEFFGDWIKEPGQRDEYCPPKE